jgi:hypothetical protein
MLNDFVHRRPAASIQPKNEKYLTGSPQLDDLTGGIKAETLYLFYGDEEARARVFRNSEDSTF